MRRPPLAGATAALLGGLWALASCRDDGGVTYPELGVFASVDGSSFRSVLCVRLPLLQGSQVDERGAVDDALEVSAEATRRGVSVRFLDGAEDVIPSVFVAREDLLDTYVHDEAIERSRSYTVRLVPDCDDPSGAVGGSGGAAGAGGSISTGGSKSSGGTGGIVGSGGTGGAGTGGVAGGPPPVVDSFSPADGPFGTTVTIRGSGFRTPETTDLAISINEQDRVVFGPASTHVLSWKDDAIRFRFPFPADGPIHLDQTMAPRLDVGTFKPSWAPGARHLLPGSTTAIAAISDGPGRIIAVLDTSPPSLVSTNGRTWTRQALTFESLRADTIRLYRAGDGIRGYALSTTDPPEILALERRVAVETVTLALALDGGAPIEGAPDAGPVPDGGGGTTTPDGGPGPDVDIIPGEAFDAIRTGVIVGNAFALAAGDAGAAVWFQDGGSWRRARPGAGRWVLDKGPIADPNPSADLHTAVATSDGALHVLWAERTGTTFDDTGTPHLQSLPSASSTFGTPEAVGDAVDDYLTTLVAESRGDGFLLRYCGSDVDNFGFSGSEYRCRLVIRRADGQFVQGTMKDDSLSRHAISGNTVGGLRCDPAAGQSFVPDAFVAGERLAIWPCSPVVAAAVDPDGLTRFIVRAGSGLYSPRER